MCPKAGDRTATPGGAALALKDGSSERKRPASADAKRSAAGNGANAKRAIEAGPCPLPLSMLTTSQ